MANTRQYAFRMPVELMSALDAYIFDLEEQTGLPVARTEAVRALLTYRLRELGYLDAPKPKSRKRK